MAWQTFELPKIPSGLGTAVDGLKTIASTSSEALKLVKSLVEALGATATTSLSASQIAINTAVATIQAAVKALTEDTGVYVLLVPPRSKVIIPEAVKAVLAPSLFIAPTPEGLKTQAMFAGQPTTVQENAILRGLFSATGGNAGFVRQVTESFDDLGDDNRPQLGKTDAVAGIYIVAGAENIASIIPFTNGMSSLLAPGKPTALDAPALPTPQNLRAKAVNGPAVSLKWDYQPPTVEIPALGTFASVTEVAIIKSTSVKTLSATTSQGLFGTTQLRVGTKTGDGKTEVVAIIPHTGVDFKSVAIDSTEHKPGVGYYYAASYHVKLGTSKELASGGGSDLGFLRLSNVAKVYYPNTNYGTPRSITGVPPDWYRTPRTIDLFPAVGDLLSQVVSLTAQLGNTTKGYSDLLKANVKVVEQQILGYTDLAARLSAAAASIASFSTIDLGTVSSRAFAGTGGVDFVKKDLVKAFGDTSDPNRPPFDNNEFVTGVVILATTPNAVALLEQLLGSISSGASAVALALEKIDVVLTNIEAAVFNDDMSPHAAVPVPSTSATSSAALTSLVGEQAGYCYHSYEPNVEFDDNLNPI
jgi:hypothetical protein